MAGWSIHNLVIPQDSARRHFEGGNTSAHSGHRDHGDLSSNLLALSSQSDGGDYSHISGPTFCTKDNILNSVGYVNQELELLGLPLLKLDTNQGSFDTVSFINRMYDLLTLYHKTLAVKENIEERNHKLSCESEHRHSVTVRMKHLQEQSDRDMAKEQEKFRQLNVKYKQICSKMKTEKDEAKRLTAAIHSRDVQHRHELKKKEREIHRLKERLHQLLADKVPDRKVGMDLMHVVGLTEGRRATWKVGPNKQEEEMYQLLINNYEDRHQELMQENSELRDCLLSLHRELSALLKRTGDMSTTSGVESLAADVSSEDDSDDSTKQSNKFSMADLDEGYFQMPYDMVRQEVERTFKETCHQITESMRKSMIRTVTKSHPSVLLPKSVSSSGGVENDGSADRHQGAAESAEMEKLKRQILTYKAIIEQQEELIQQSLSSQSHSVENSFLHESQLLQEKENLSEQKRLFFEEKSNFEKERRAYTEAAIRLGKERQALQEERANFLKQHFLSLSPFKDGGQKKAKSGGSNSRLLPSTPVFSPARSKAKDANLPTAADLYKALGLNTQHRTSNSTEVSEDRSDTESLSESVPPVSSTKTAKPSTSSSSNAPSSTSTLPETSAASLPPSDPTDPTSLFLANIKASLMRRGSAGSKRDGQHSSSSSLKKD